MSTVSLKNVAKTYGVNEVIHGIDLDIESGEFVVCCVDDDESSDNAHAVGRHYALSGRIRVPMAIAIGGIDHRDRYHLHLIAVFRERVVGGLTSGGVRG